jgi:hypothetical protein
MDESRIAGRVAESVLGDGRKRKADYGDVMVYLNVFEFFAAEGGDWNADRATVVRLENAIQAAAMRHSNALKESVRRTLRADSGLARFMSENGISWKK